MSYSLDEQLLQAVEKVNYYQTSLLLKKGADFNKTIDDPNSSDNNLLDIVSSQASDMAVPKEKREEAKNIARLLSLYGAQNKDDHLPNGITNDIGKSKKLRELIDKKDQVGINQFLKENPQIANFPVIGDDNKIYNSFLHYVFLNLADTKESTKQNSASQQYDELNSNAQARRDIIKILLDNGADINQVFFEKPSIIIDQTDGPREVEPYNLLSVVIFERDQDLELLDLILRTKYKVNINAQLGTGQYTPLHLAIGHAGVSSIKNTIVADKLITKGADIKAKDANGVDIFTKALMSMRLDVANLLLNKGHKFKASSEDELTMAKAVLHPNNLHDQADKKSKIYKLGVNINDLKPKFSFKQFAQQFVPQFFKKRTFKKLKKSFFNALQSANCAELVEIINNKKFESLTTEQKSQITNQLSGQDNATALIIACQSNEEELVDLLIKNNCDLNLQDTAQATALLYASVNGNGSLISKLLDQGANPNIADDGKNSPLHRAIAHFDLNLVKMLVEKGANINHTNHLKSAPIVNLENPSTENQVAAKAITHYLIDQGATVINEDLKFNILHLAARSGYKNIDELLKKEHIKPLINSQDDQRKTPLDYATENNHTATIESLKKHGTKAATITDKKDSPTTDLSPNNQAMGSNDTATTQDPKTKKRWLISSGAGAAAGICVDAVGDVAISASARAGQQF